ncbi:MAG: hypothetical protein K6U07_08195, partial [Firmicutes bacterium]|nr:hypothetical protein [Bacillota bacterium]
MKAGGPARRVAILGSTGSIGRQALEVVEALEGKITLNPCLIRAGACPLDQTCPVHDTWAEEPVGTHPQKTFVDVHDG